MDVLGSLGEFVREFSQLPIWALLLFFAFSNFFENVFPPWPGDTFVVFSGFLVSKLDAPFYVWQLLLATLLGNWVGALTMFFFGKQILDWMKVSRFPWLRNVYEEDNFHKTIAWFKSYSVLLIILSRFSAGIRFFVAIIAGMSQMRPISFLFYYTIAISLWCGLLIYAGYFLGDRWDQIIVSLSIYNRIVSIFIIFIVLLFLGIYFSRKKLRS
ncbi:SNARE-like domain protein [Leptospira ryugenii]|uniref:SNARE-like domain protein n=1 Tax=Leptospira ryugenii TaxID=1917863 RepID=A0A2P2DX95_9LEPT|nr:SNARE-like domain protein [Leptospira ryugenii]